MKKYHFGEKLQNRELNLVLRKTAIIVISNQAVFVKYCPDFKVFFLETMKGISNFVFSLMSYMVGHFNNSRAFKNTFLKLSYKAVN